MVTDEQWRSIFQEQSTSGLTQKKFCESKGISLKSFCSRKSRMKSAGTIKVKPKKYNFIRAQKEESKVSIQQAAIVK